MPTISWFMAPPDVETLSDNRTDKRSVSALDNIAVTEAAVTDAVSEAQAVSAAAVTTAAVSKTVDNAADSEAVDEPAVSEAVDDGLVAKVRWTLYSTHTAMYTYSACYIESCVAYVLCNCFTECIYAYAL
jgi:hypothetical protein